MKNLYNLNEAKMGVAMKLILKNRCMKSKSSHDPVISMIVLVRKYVRAHMIIRTKDQGTNVKLTRSNFELAVEGIYVF